MSLDAEKLQQGAALAQQGRFAEARVEFDSILANDPNHLDALFMKGACYYKEGNSYDAADCWNRVLSIDPGHARASAMLAKVQPPASGGFGSDFGSFGSTPAPAAAPTAAPPKPKAASAKAPAKSGKPILKYAAILVVVGVIGGFGFDMYSNPNSYPFLKKEAPQPGAETSAAAPAAAPARPTVSLQDGLSGKWFFLFQGSPSEFNFYPDGKLAVTINREGGMTFTLDGKYEIKDGSVVLELNGPEGPMMASLENARIEGPNFIFNYDGQEIRAERR